jgi:hypothetical protein
MQGKAKGTAHPIAGPEGPGGGVEVYLYSFFNLSARWECVVNAMPWPLYSRERPSTHCIGGWVSHRASLDRCRKSGPQWDSIPGLGGGGSLDGCRKSHPHWDSIRGPSSPQWVAIPTALSRPFVMHVHLANEVVSTMFKHWSDPLNCNGGTEKQCPAMGI